MTLFVGEAMVVALVLAAPPEPSLEARARAFAPHYQRPTAIPGASKNGALIALGRQLFFDPRLSASRTTSCATCHNPALSFADGLPRALGDSGKTLQRRTPSLLDVAWGLTFMWDGRFETLEAQALSPLLAADEMNVSEAELRARLDALPEYRAAFAKLFPGQGPTLATVSQALAAFERTLVSGTAPFDRWVKGDAKALSDSAKLGFVLFNTKAQCANCHSGWRFTDEGFHDIGVADAADLGRGGVAPYQKLTVMQHAFKTPSLRDTARRGPWMHDGSARTLAAVVQLYDAGGDVRRPSLSGDIHPLGLSAEEQQALVTFMESLSAPRETAIPVLPTP